MTTVGQPVAWRSRKTAAIAGMAVVLAGAGGVAILSRTHAATAASSEACIASAEMQAKSLVESQEFTPFAKKRSTPPNLPLDETTTPVLPGNRAAAIPSGRSGKAAPASLAAQLTLQAVTTAQAGGAHLYYADSPIAKGMKFDQFAVSGGALLSVEATNDATRNYAEDLRLSLGDRAVPLALGPYSATLVWADPMENGVRTHNLYWSTTEYNYSLIANLSPDLVAGLGASIACAP